MSIFNATKIELTETIEFLKFKLTDLGLPFVSIQGGTFGYDSIILTIGFDCKENWPHKIFENSNYTRMYITSDGKIECLGQSVYNYVDTKLMPVPVKFRKCRAKSKEDMVVRISKYLQDLQNCLIKP